MSTKVQSSLDGNSWFRFLFLQHFLKQLNIFKILVQKGLSYIHTCSSSCSLWGPSWPGGRRAGRRSCRRPRRWGPWSWTWRPWCWETPTSPLWWSQGLRWRMFDAFLSAVTSLYKLFELLKLSKTLIYREHIQFRDETQSTTVSNVQFLRINILWIRWSNYVLTGTLRG